ncbi:MAG: hypothetical protein KKA19_01775, partial [Candidatus Margulisbacteria bacterium]|nr:hypothetical protein [Candidatus Margulisiibacteriota bacterium]
MLRVEQVPYNSVSSIASGQIPVKKSNPIQPVLIASLLGRNNLSANDKNWLNLLSQELKSHLNAEQLQEIKGMKFSEIAQIFSVRFGVEIKSPQELILALWINADRKKSVTPKNPAPTVAEILGNK